MERSAVRRRVRSPVLSAAPAREPELAPVRSALVVEADPDLQTQMARALRNEGLQVVATGSGGGALALVSEWDVELILIAESLPGRSGVDLVRELRRTRPGSRIVMVTSHAEPRFEAAARAAGALGCVVKPLLAKQLPRLLAECSDRVLPHAVSPERARNGVSRRTPAVSLTNSAHPTRRAVAE